MEIAENIRSALDRPYALGDSSDTFHTTASIGITMFAGRDQSAEDLVKHADIAMFEAKDHGRNRVCFYRRERQTAITSRHAMFDDLRQAVETGALQLHYQPELRPDGGVSSLEGLLRWQRDPDRLLEAGEFIALAEETGLIVPIGQWVLETACRDQAELIQRHPDFKVDVAVNVSAKQMADEGFVDQLRGIAARTGADVRRLRLELTESSLIEDVECTVEVLRRLREMGVSIDLDDFGTGYSLLASLKMLPLDAVKLDKTLVRDVGSEIGSAVVRAAMAMARALELKVVAEGVETPIEEEFLVEAGVDLMQGFLFAPPMPLSQVVSRYVVASASAAERSEGKRGAGTGPV